MAGNTIQSKSLENYLKEAKEHTKDEFMKKHEESCFFVGNVPAATGDASQKLAFSTLPGGSLKDLDKKVVAGQIVYEIPFDKLSSGQMLWVGRAGNCMIQIEHPSVSKLQGYIKLDLKEKKIVYADTGSKNGSRIDNKAISPNMEYPLVSGHTLGFGETIRLQFYSLPDFRDMLECLK
ncbi:MAG: FHA domain-containing protein [Candidatus Woesearchaeota archaeon]